MHHKSDGSFAHIAFPSPDRPEALSAEGKLAAKGMRCEIRRGAGGRGPGSAGVQGAAA